MRAPHQRQTIVLGTRWLHASQTSRGESSSCAGDSMMVSTTASCAIVFQGFRCCAGFKVNASIVERETNESGRIEDLRLSDTLKNKAISLELLNRT